MSGQPGQEKCRLHLEYLKISGFQKPTIIAESFNRRILQYTYRNNKFGGTGFSFDYKENPEKNWKSQSPVSFSLCSLDESAKDETLFHT